MDTRQPRRIPRKLSSKERQRLERHQEQVAAELPEMVARDQLRKDAREEATLSGQLRCACDSGYDIYSSSTAKVIYS
jgi:hypothetical protein